jgi:uncharacterized metal-binding protein
MNNEEYKNLPLVYSCSGCSNVAQLANDIALKLDQDKIAEMSCIAGVGGDVPALVKTAKSGRDIIAIDGCPLSCTRACLSKLQITPKCHIELSKLSIKKKFHEKCDKNIFDQMYSQIIQNIKSC